MTKPMKTEHLPSGHHGHNPHHTPEPTPGPTPPPVSGTATLKARTMNHPSHDQGKVSPEDFAAGKTPNSGKLKKDGSPVPGQDAAHDAKRAAERAAEAAGGVEPPEVPEVTPEPTPPPVV